MSRSSTPHFTTSYEVVVFSENDPDDPKNWSQRRKDWILAMICILAFVGVFGSSIYAPGQGQIRQLYGVSTTTANAGLSLYVAGLGVGPLLCPLTEMYGKRKPYVISWVLMIVAITPSAFAENIVVILVFRFLTGFCAACSLNTGNSIVADIYPSSLHALSHSITIFVLSALTGPCFGSLVGFFVAAHSRRQLWVLRVHLFFAIALIPVVLMLPETYPPAILASRAKKLRKRGKGNARAAHELHGKTILQVVQGHILRPLAMIVREPIVQGAAAWISLGYGIIYFYFEAYPVVFIEQHGIPFQLCGLMFLAVTLGMVLAVLPYTWLVQTFRRLPLLGIERVGTDPKELNLKVVLSACILLPLALFWFAWTSEDETHWIAPALAGIPFGYSSIMVFFAFLSYSSHTYGVYSSSANAANTFVRSIVASAFPLFGTPLLNNLGTKWGLSLFGFLSIGLLPVPLIYIRYGAALRERSYFARQAREVAACMHEQVNVVLAGDGTQVAVVDGQSGLDQDNV
ncbi:unnamed protein product [Somion occarium]|uniref:Major facilitator superfamily (MFS) profile domain-containing protein n=1 Tax=Somion occarium TaxID=3059160 RepID=A0ABP1E7T7_9APHY